jgi:hypothetical protein
MSSSNDDWEDDNGDADDSEYSSSDGDDDDDDEGRSLLWLCQEGETARALIRVRRWDSEYPLGVFRAKKDEKAASAVRRDMFRRGTGGNSVLHEILMGGVTNPEGSSADLVRRLVRRMRHDFSDEAGAIFEARPRPHGRTLLHWCAWGNAHISITREVLLAHPESLCLRDRDTRHHSARTPLELAKRYWPEKRITSVLQRITETYLPYRVQFTIHLSVYRHYVTDNRAPFDKMDRKRAGMSPRPWFVASVLGYCIQREMKPLLLHILSFVGKGAKVYCAQNTKRRKAISNKKAPKRKK